MRYELEQLVKGAPRAVFEVLSTPERIPTLHPLIEEVVVTRREPGLVEFELSERVPVGPISVPNRYRGRFRTVEVPELRLVAHGESAPRVVVDAEYSFTAVAGGTLVRETLVVAAPLGLGGFVGSTAEAAHRRQLEALAKCFGG